MGTDYAQVHLYWNIPLGLLLAFIYRPLCTSLDVYKICFLVAIAVTATIPWDSYLIRNNVWSYPCDAVLGPTLLDIPIEELFFFVIQTFNTSLIYCLLSKPTFHPVYLCGETSERPLVICKWIGGSTIVCAIGLGAFWVWSGGEGFYMGLILVWAGPFMLLLWMLAYQFIVLLPLKDTVLPIVLPTLYLWLVDTLALRRGTWVIENGTKLNMQLWEGLDIEEAVFFMATNTMIVFGLIAFDNAMAILNTFPATFPNHKSLASPWVLVRALLVPTRTYNEAYILGLKQAFARLQKKSRSFSIASGVFPGRVRIDLILLYSFCRMADDLVDEADSITAARAMISKLRIYLNLTYSPNTSSDAVESYISSSFPSFAHDALRFLPTRYLLSKPLYLLLDGFEMDLNFDKSSFPMKTDAELELYAERVAGTVAEMCIGLIYHHHYPDGTSLVKTDEVQNVLASGRRMAVGLQLINIARDIQTDALMGRVYIPSSRLKAFELRPPDILQVYEMDETDCPGYANIESLRSDILDWATKIYQETRADIERLPSSSRGGVRVMVESYIEIGRVMLREGSKGRQWGRHGKATVNWWSRLWVAWRAMVG